MSSKIRDRLLKHRLFKNRFFLQTSTTLFVLLVFLWVLTCFWGTKEVHQDYIKLNRAGMPAQTKIYADKKPLDYSKIWVSITDPWAPLPCIVSIELDMTGSCLWWQPARQYFFWVPGYHSKEPFFGRPVTESFDDSK